MTVGTAQEKVPRPARLPRRRPESRSLCPNGDFLSSIDRGRADERCRIYGNGVLGVAFTIAVGVFPADREERDASSFHSYRSRGKGGGLPGGSSGRMARTDRRGKSSGYSKP